MGTIRRHCRMPPLDLQWQMQHLPVLTGTGVFISQEIPPSPVQRTYFPTKLHVFKDPLFLGVKTQCEPWMVCFAVNSVKYILLVQWSLRMGTHSSMVSWPQRQSCTGYHWYHWSLWQKQESNDVMEVLSKMEKIDSTPA